MEVGTPCRWGNPLWWGKKNYHPVHAILQPRHPGVHWMVAKHVNNTCMFRRVMLLYTHLLLLLQPSVPRLSIVTFNNDVKQPKWNLREFDVSRLGPRLGGLPHLGRVHGKIWPRPRGLTGHVNRPLRACLHGGGGPQVSEVTRLSI